MDYEEEKETYTERLQNIEAASESTSASGTEAVPSNNMGKSDGNSSNNVSRTALNCSCACNIDIE